MIFNRFDTGRQRRGGERLGKTDLIGIATPLRTLAIVGLDLAPASLSHRPRGISGISRFFSKRGTQRTAFLQRTDGRGDEIESDSRAHLEEAGGRLLVATSAPVLPGTGQQSDRFATDS